MCVYSMIGDHFQDKFDWARQYVYQPDPPAISRAEFDQLKRDVQDMKALLEKAAEYDKRNNEPDCEMEDKIAFLRKVAEFVGIPDAVKPA